MEGAKKQFVEPVVREEASLVDVTLFTGGTSGPPCCAT